MHRRRRAVELCPWCHTCATDLLTIPNQHDPRWHRLNREHLVADDRKAEGSVGQDRRVTLQHNVGRMGDVTACRRHPQGNHRDHHFLQADATVMKRKVSASSKYRQTAREDEIQIGLVSKLGAGNPDRGTWSVPTPTCPTASVLVHRFTTGLVHHHVFVFSDGELVTVIAGDHETLDTDLGELANGSSEIPNHRVHDLACEQSPIHLAETVNGLGTHDDELACTKLFLDGFHGLLKQLTKIDVECIWANRLEVLRALRQIGQRAVTYLSGQLRLVIHERETAGRSGQQRRHSHRSNGRQDRHRRLQQHVLTAVELLHQVGAHLVAHGIHEEVGQLATTGFDQIGVDVRLLQHAGGRPLRIHQGLREALGHLLEQAFVIASDHADGTFQRLFGLILHLGDPGFHGALGSVDAKPSIFCRVGLDPPGRSPRHLLHLRAHLGYSLPQLGHQTAGLPLGQPAQKAGMIHPEAAAASQHDIERIRMMPVGDE